MISPEFHTKQEKARQLRYARSQFRRINSLDLIPEYPSQEEESADSSTESRHPPCIANSGKRRSAMQLVRKPSMSVALSNGMRKVLFFWPNLLAKFLMMLVRYILFIPLSIAAPSFWLSALLWMFWKLIWLPVHMVKWITSSESLASSSSTSASASAGASNAKRTILISCGSTIQSLHLARNLHCSGVRVVVFEFEGLFGVARFSSAVDKFYVVPKPTIRNPDSYITALCQIVKKERVSVYIPVCATSSAYYDALAKPHLELLNCASFIPGLQDTVVLDDCLQFYQKCAAQNIPLPPHSVVSSLSDLWHLYDSGFIRNFRNILMAVGMQGLLERYKYILPTSRRDFNFNHDISERQQWMVVRDLPGEHFVTCTTVKDSRVVANVACKVEHDTKNLLPLPTDSGAVNSDESQIDIWLQTFFAKVRFQRTINGHISFRLIRCQVTGQLMPLGVRLGVSIPYICYNRSHAQVLYRTIKCVHHMRQLSRSEEASLSAFSTSWRWSALDKSNASVTLDKREALFAYWDPLPYCAYYHFQLPLKSVKTFLQRRRRTAKALSPRMTMPVH